MKQLRIKPPKVASWIFALISLFIQFELSFDRFHENIDRMYRVEQILDHGTYKEPDAGCPTPLSQVLVTDLIRRSHSYKSQNCARINKRPL